MGAVSAATRLRFSQIRLFSRLFEKLSFHRSTRSLFTALGRSAVLSRALVGFRRGFSSFAAARLYASRYDLPFHEHPSNVLQHNQLNQAARPSDYPVLFYLQNLVTSATNVLDIGGNAGNLFYCYDRYLKLPRNLTWTVFDLPENIARGRAMAEERGQDRLRFIDKLEDCTAAEVVIISGSLHYFEELPPDLTRYLDPPPKHLFINRTPVNSGPTVVTLQDAFSYYAMAPARILSRDDLIGAMADAHYDLVDEWSARELHLNLPLDPELSASAYSGFYFRRQG